MNDTLFIDWAKNTKDLSQQEITAIYDEIYDTIKDRHFYKRDAKNSAYAAIYAAYCSIENEDDPNKYSIACSWAGEKSIKAAIKSLYKIRKLK